MENLLTGERPRIIAQENHIDFLGQWIPRDQTLALLDMNDKSPDYLAEFLSIEVQARVQARLGRVRVRGLLLEGHWLLVWILARVSEDG